MADQDGIFEPSTWHDSNHATTQRSSVRCVGTPWLRDTADTLPSRISAVRNVATPLQSASGTDTSSAGDRQSPARATQLRSGKRTAQEAHAARGLTLSAEKTRHLTEGFDFLGFTIKHYPSTPAKASYRVRIMPSKASIHALRQELGAVWRRDPGANGAAVLRDLTPMMRGGANYFRLGSASKVFSSLDNWMVL